MAVALLDAEDSVYQSIQGASPELLDLIRFLDRSHNDSLCGFIQGVFLHLVGYAQCKGLMSREVQIGNVVFDSVAGLLKAEIREKRYAGGFPVHYTTPYGRTKTIRRVFEDNPSWKNFLINLFRITKEMAAFYACPIEQIRFLKPIATPDGQRVVAELQVPTRTYSR